MIPAASAYDNNARALRRSRHFVAVIKAIEALQKQNERIIQAFVLLSDEVFFEEVINEEEDGIDHFGEEKQCSNPNTGIETRVVISRSKLDRLWTFLRFACT